MHHHTNDISGKCFGVIIYHDIDIIAIYRPALGLTYIFTQLHTQMQVMCNGNKKKKEKKCIKNI